MNLRKISEKLNNKKGATFINLLLGIAAIGILAVSVIRWGMSVSDNVSVDAAELQKMSDLMEMEAIAKNYWQKMLDTSYDEVNAEIITKGRKWTQDIAGKYDMTVQYTTDSKYENALCKIGTTPGATDRRCRQATITLVSKIDPSLVRSFRATRVAAASMDAQLSALANAITAEENKFRDYYSKTDADSNYACPWDYHMVSGKCVPCTAPSGDKQYRSGNCTIGTCSTGYKANSSRTGCTQITCPSGYVLNGDNCEPLTCPDGYKINASNTGCEKCPVPSSDYNKREYAYNCKILVCPNDGTHTFSLNDHGNSCEVFCGSGWRYNSNRTGCVRAWDIADLYYNNAKTNSCMNEKTVVYGETRVYKITVDGIPSGTIGKCVETDKLGLACTKCEINGKTYDFDNNGFRGKVYKIKAIHYCAQSLEDKGEKYYSYSQFPTGGNLPSPCNEWTF